MKKTIPPFLTEEKKQDYLRDVDVYKDLSYQFLWEMVASQLIPRSFAVTVPQTHGCLVCGHSVMEHGDYPYILDYLNNRWKIVCPSCGYTFPTNDFEAYYKGGLDEFGFFKPDLAKKHNRALIAKGEKGNLVNILYPEKGETWGVDDGTGYEDPETGIHYAFIGYYNTFAWSFTNRPNISNALQAYKNAYLATGDLRYAEQGIVLLDRIADVYPELDLARWPMSEGYLNSNGGGIDKGKAVGSIWECALVTSFMKAFQVFADVLKEDRAPNAVAFIREKKHRVRHIEEETARTVYDRIMHGIVEQVYPNVMLTNITGNFGTHQSSLALAAVLWDRLPETKEWLDYNFRTNAGDRYLCSGGDISNVMVDVVDRDGYGNEASPGYNAGWLIHSLQIVDALDGYTLGGESWDLYRHPKFRKMFTTMYPLIVSDLYTATIGDSGASGQPFYTARTNYLIQGFLKYGDPEFVQAAYYVNKNRLEGMDLTGFSESPEAIAEKVKAVIAEHGTLDLRGTLLTGYGFIALRDGTSGKTFLDPKTTDQRSLWVYFGTSLVSHSHYDALNLGIHAHGLDLSPEMGYPRYSDSLDMHRQSVVKNTISHNTVMINEKHQDGKRVGDPLHYDCGDRVKLFDVAAESAYSGIADTYRRTSAMVRIDEEDSYIIDFFRVSGGEKHVYSFHGAEHCGIAATGLALVKQADEKGNYIGTYAGADTEYPINADVKDLSGARYLINVDKQSGGGDFAVDYNVCDTWNILGGGEHAATDVHVKLTMLGTFDEVALADMRPPENKPGRPERLRYVLATRKGENLQSCYTAVIEPYRGKSKIAAIEAMTVTENGQEVCPMCARAVKVTLTSGRVDYIVNAVDPAALYTVSDGETEFAFSGFFGVWSCEGGCDSYYLNDGAQIGEYLNPGLSAITGTVADFTRELAVENEIVVSAEQAAIDTDALAGCLINIEKSEPGYNAAYRIKSAVFRGDGKLVLNIGDVTTIRSYADKYDFSKGYVYDIAEGKPFRIPLAIETK